jgi:TM2 domain-containing membrane protein YozV
VGSWYYISQHGQIGPLGEQQVRNLVQGNIIGPQTPMWRPGMADWQPAGQIPELASFFAGGGTAQQTRFFQAPGPSAGRGGPQAYDPQMLMPYSEKSRVAAGVLNLVIPGVGRMYLGYYVIGILQLVVAILSVFILCGGGWLWSFVDGIIILNGGGVSHDAEGRPLAS